MKLENLFKKKEKTVKTNDKELTEEELEKVMGGAPIVNENQELKNEQDELSLEELSNIRGGIPYSEELEEQVKMRK